jgi:hypothetical protein
MLDHIVDPHGDPAMLIELHEIACKVEAMLNELPVNILATFEAVLEGDTTYEQAAEQLNIPRRHCPLTRLQSQGRHPRSCLNKITERKTTCRKTVPARI